MDKWEYKIIRDTSSEHDLNKLGAEGWELVAAVAKDYENISFISILNDVQLRTFKMYHYPSEGLGKVSNFSARTRGRFGQETQPRWGCVVSITQIPG
jgi:hypothetical protein